MTMGVQVRKGLINEHLEGLEFIEKYRQGAERLGKGAYGTYDSEQDCFYCDEKLSGEAILYWRGNAKTQVDLSLHPGCFVELTTRLFRDLHAIESVMDYRVVRDASPRPPYPPKPISTERWAVWRKLRDKMRDLSLVRQ